MDSQHRHELKENDLANFAAGFKEWWGKYQLIVLGAAVVVAAIVLVLRLRAGAVEAAHTETWLGLNTTSEAADFQQIAASTEDATARAVANLRGANAMMQRILQPAAPGDAGLSQDEKEEMVKDARDMYQAVVDAKIHQLLTLNAKLGLAAVAETRGEWETARSIYESIEEEAGAGASHFAQQAAARQAMLPRMQEELVWAKETTTLPDNTPDVPQPLNPDDPDFIGPLLPGEDGGKAGADQGATKDAGAKVGEDDAAKSAGKDGAANDGAANDGAAKDGAAKDGAAKTVDDRSGTAKDGSEKDSAGTTTDEKSGAPKNGADTGDAKSGDAKSGDDKSGAKSGDDADQSGADDANDKSGAGTDTGADANNKSPSP